MAVNDAFKVTPLQKSSGADFCSIPCKDQKATRVTFSSRVHSIRDVVADVCTRASKADEIDRLPFGLPILDRVTRGVDGGELTFTLGRTDSLKTMQQDSHLRHIVHRTPGAGVLVVTMEMPRIQRTTRWLRMEFGLTETGLEEAIKKGTLDLEGFCRRYRNVYLLDAGSVTLERIEEEAASLVDLFAPDPLAAIFIDHAGLIRAGRSSSAYERASQTAIGLKQLARTLNVPVFCILQANRAGKSDDSPVAMESARDSGCFEENADFILAFSSKVQPRGEQPFVKLRLVKNRRGPNASLRLSFDPKTLRMAERVEAGDA